MVGAEELNGFKKTTTLEQTEECIKPYVPLNTLLGVQVIFTNFFVVLHYGRKYRKFVPCMYLHLALLDGAMVICMFAQSAILGIIIYPEASDSSSGAIWSVLITTVLMGVFYRLSIICNVVFSVARTYKIVRPFTRIQMKPALIYVFLWGVFWTGIGINDVVQIEKSIGYSLDTYLMQGPLGAGIVSTNQKGSTTRLTVEFLLYSFSFFFPVLICVICFCVLFHSTKRSNSITDESAENSRHVTITVFWLTVLFEGCTLASCVFFCITEFYHDLPTNVHTYGHSIFYITLPLLNAAISPFIIIFRSRKLTNKFKNFWTCGRSRRNMITVSENVLEVTPCQNDNTQT